jgi:hypothetical protein
VLARFGFVASLAIAACAVPGPEEGDEPPPSDEIDEELVGGQHDAQNAYPWVVRIPGCTASKIEERKYLTAAHCVSTVAVQDGYIKAQLLARYSGLPKPFLYSKKRFEPSAETDGLFDARLKVVSVTLHPTWRDGVPAPRGAIHASEQHLVDHLISEGGKDVAIITVNVPDNDVPYAPILNTRAAPASGSMVTVVGTGTEDPPIVGWRVRFGSKPVIARADLEAVEPPTSPPGARLAKTHGFMFYTRRAGGLAPTSPAYPGCTGGDSGGPLLQGGRIVGVHHGTTLDANKVGRWDDHVSISAVAGWLRTPDVLCASTAPHKRPPYDATADACDCPIYQRFDGDKCVDDASAGCFVDRSRTFRSVMPGTVGYLNEPDLCARDLPALHRVEAGVVTRAFATEAFAGAPVDGNGVPVDVYTWLGTDRDTRRDVLHRTVDAVVERLSEPTIPKVVPIDTKYPSGAAQTTLKFTAVLHEAGANPAYYPDQPAARCNIQARATTGPTRWLTYNVRFPSGADRGLQVIVERPFAPTASGMARFDGHVGKVYVSYNFGKSVFLIPPGFSKWLRNVHTAPPQPTARCEVRAAKALDGSTPGLDHCELDTVSRTLTDATTTGSPVELPSLWLPNSTFAIAATTMNHTRYRNLAGNIGRDLVIMSRHHSMSREKPADEFTRATASHWLRAPTVQSGDVHTVTPLQRRGAGYYTLSVFPNAVGAAIHNVSMAAKVYSPARCGAPQTCFGAAGSNCTSPNIELSAAGLCLPAAGQTRRPASSPDFRSSMTSAALRTPRRSDAVARGPRSIVNNTSTRRRRSSWAFRSSS